MADIQEKLDQLIKLIKGLESVVVGFSGGVDSAFLSAAAFRALGDKAVAATAYSATLPESEKEEAVLTAKQIGIRHVLLPISELVSPGFVANEKDRCYHCKQIRFSTLRDWAHQHGYRWVLDGSNADDIGDYRPGMRAVDELESVRSPLLEIGLTKAEIRQLSKDWGLRTWNKLSGACLSSRLPYGQQVTEEKLRQVEAAEKIVKAYCSGQVRVRHHGNLARIEVEQNEFFLLIKPEVAASISRELVKIGFTFVTLDLLGYRVGSLNEALE